MFIFILFHTKYDKKYDVAAMVERITITIKKDMLKRIDNTINGREIRSRSHAEYLPIINSHAKGTVWEPMSEFVMQKKIVIKCIKQKKIKQGVMFRPEVLIPHRIIDEDKKDEEKKEIQVDSFERS